MSQKAAKRILFVMNSAKYFVLNRLGTAVAAKRAGYETHAALVIDDQESYDQIRQAGIEVHPYSMHRRSLNPLGAVDSARQLDRIICDVDPDLIHSLTIKAVILSGILCRLYGIPNVALIPGRGSAFSMSGWKGALLRKLAVFLYRRALSSEQSRVIFQNRDDRDLFVRERVVPVNRTSIIQGSGVSLEKFGFVPYDKAPRAPRTVICASRLLREKGILEFLEATEIVHQENAEVRFLLAGDPDPGNPGSLSADEVREQCLKAGVEWLGHVDDMPELLRSADIVCLPTYYNEGLPMTLLQAAAVGRPLITTDVAGCRDIVVDHESGILIPPKSSQALAEAILEMIETPEACSGFGLKARAAVEKEFVDEVVHRKTLKIYQELSDE